MFKLNNTYLLNMIRYAPVIVVFVFALAVNLIVLDDNRKHAAQSIENLREELTFERKETIRSEVHQVYEHLLVEKSKTESKLKQIAKQRVDEALRIANFIFVQNINKTEAEITDLIIEALRPARFFGGRGYYFIIDNNGMKLLNPTQPENEGTSVLDLKDHDGHYFVRDMIEITKNQGQGFLHYSFKKPGLENEKQFTKISYVGKFTPYQWTIGTGEYIDDFEKKIKENKLKWFTEYEYSDYSYFFVLDKSGKLLSHHANDFLGSDFVIGEQVQQDIFNDIKEKASEGGGYINFAKPLTLDGNTKLDYVSYIKAVPGWDWIIGTGFSAQAFEKHLRLKKQEFERINHQRFMRLLGLSILSMILLTASSLYIGNLIAGRFSIFQRQIEKDFDDLTNTKNTMEYMALHDALTDLPNRVSMVADIQEKLSKAKKNNTQLAVMFVDLDNFKHVNDLHGHNTGDHLLGVVSKRFQALVGLDDSVYRFGGDEFVFCYTNIRDMRQAEDYAKRVIDILTNPIVIEGKTHNVGCSIGVSMFPNDGDDAEKLISQADTVLYKSKADKKGQVQFYCTSISKQIKRRIEIEHELLRAIEQETLSVKYQPQLSTKDQKLISVEALARWNHQQLGEIFPDEFISIAENAGLIHALDMFVFKRACQDIYQLCPNGENALVLAVNISPMQLLEPNFAAELIDVCNSVGIEAKRIILEVTENIFIHGLDTVQPVLEELREHGFGLSLDDFGTGYSSLSYINNLPLTEIKIDRSFTNKFLDSEQSDMLVKMIISIGQSCNLLVVAEGVETKAQHEKLVEYDCALVQGYYFARALSIEQLKEFKQKPGL